MFTKFLAVILTVCSVATLAIADDKPVEKIADGTYVIDRNTFLGGNGFRVFTWHDGKSYIAGKFTYQNNVRMAYELELQKVPGDKSNHFVAKGSATASGCSWNAEIDLYAYEDKVYAAVYAPEYSTCGTSSYSWEHFQEPFQRKVPPAPPVKPVCACKEVVTASNEVLCTLAQVPHAVLGNCTKATCDSLIKDAGGACVAPSTELR